MGRYSMHGLEMYGDDLGAFMTGDDLRNALMAAGSGGAGILATAYILRMMPNFVGGDAPTADDQVTNSRIKSLIGLAIGVVGGRAIDMYYSRDVAMGFTGAVAGGSLAALISSWAGNATEGDYSGQPVLPTSLAMGYRGLADADLAALEATVATNAGAYRAPALASPVVDSQMLRGTMTSTEEIAAYSHLMDQQSAPPPSF